jgi:hypothetical protein
VGAVPSEQPEHGRPEQDAGNKLPGHRRLTHALEHFAEQSPDENQRHDLKQKDDLRRGFLPTFRGQRSRQWQDAYDQAENAE